MIEYYCDKCKKEVNNKNYNLINISINLDKYIIASSVYLCLDCVPKFQEVIKKYVEMTFVKM